jgi:hypothetical protein
VLKTRAMSKNMSLKKAEAGRRNAQSSSGPEAARGKPAARLNGLRHGGLTRPVRAWSRKENESAPSADNRSPSPVSSPPRRGLTIRCSTVHLGRRLQESHQHTDGRPNTIPTPRGPRCAKRSSLVGKPDCGGLGKPLGKDEGEPFSAAGAILKFYGGNVMLGERRIPLLSDHSRSWPRGAARFCELLPKHLRHNALRDLEALAVPAESR